MAGLVKSALETLAPRQRQIVTLVWLSGADRRSATSDLDVSHQYVAQVLATAGAILTRRFFSLAQAVVGGVCVALTDAGGLIHQRDVESLCGAKDLAEVAFLLRLVSERKVYLWRQEFLSTIPPNELERRCRKRPATSARLDASTDLAGLVATTHGFRLSADGARRLVALMWASPPATHRVARVLRDALLCTLENAAGPVPLLTLWEMTSDLLGQPSPVDPTHGRKHFRHLYEGLHRIEIALDREPDVVRVGRSLFAHRSAVSAELRRLDGAVSRCIGWLRLNPEGSTSAALNVWFRRSFPELSDVHLQLLQTALLRRPEIIAHAHTYRHVDAILVGTESIEARLLRALCAAPPEGLTWMELLEDLPRMRHVLDFIVLDLLEYSPGVARLETGRYVSRERLGLNEAALMDIVAKVLRVLPGHGGGRPLDRVLSEISAKRAGLRGEVAKWPASLLLQMLCREPRLRVVGLSAVRRAREGEWRPSHLANVVGRYSQGAHYRDVQAALYDELGYSRPRANIHQALQRLVRQGLLASPTYGVYHLVQPE